MAKNKITCPSCKKSFELSATEYSDIVSQVRTKEFNQQVDSAVQVAVEKAKTDAKLSLASARAELQQRIAELEIELESATEKAGLKSEKAISAVRLEAKNRETKLEQKIIELEHELESVTDKIKLKSEKTIAALQLELQSKEATFKEQVKANETSFREQLRANEDSFEKQLKAKDEIIAFYKDFKAKLSTKNIGESLEKYCFTEFNKIRSIAFPNATFEKDNLVVNGTKGDFIFREYDADSGVELISIMFEMKNEADDTETKHKNKEFFKKLDKDRKNKKCEYAILVSTLQADSEYYNAGIVDVSHKYDKMYVIRPQFFIPVIGFLRNASLHSLQAKRELARVQSENIDITNFEERLQEFKEAFGRNYRIASEKFEKAVEQIDKTINQLHKIRDMLVGSDRQLALASAKADNISVAKLTKDNPTMRAKFKAVGSGSNKKKS